MDIYSLYIYIQSKYVEGSRQRMDRPDRNDLSSEGFYPTLYSELTKTDKNNNKHIMNNKYFSPHKQVKLYFFLQDMSHLSSSDCTCLFIRQIVIFPRQNLMENGRYRKIARAFDWFILPIANPDGYRYSRQVKGQCYKHYSKIILHLTSKLNN